LLKHIQDYVDFSEAGGVTIWASQQISVDYTQVFGTGILMSACHGWNENEDADRTLIDFKTQFDASYDQHKKTQGESATTSGCHATHVDVAKTEDEMADATTGALKTWQQQHHQTMK
jgi:hypothetical protein